MCGRYTMANPDPKRLKLRFGLDESVHISEEPRFNIAPTDPVLAVRELADGRDLGTLRWGLVPGKWATERKGRPLINARAETLETQPAFRDAFRERRCLIPADGFYEWRRDENGKVPIWFSMPGAEPFAFAGIWAEFRPRDGEPVHSCAIVTTKPNGLVAPIHDRMPVILAREAEDHWISPDAEPGDLQGLLVAPPDDVLVAREVGDFVNSVREDGPQLIEPRVEAKALF